MSTTTTPATVLGAVAPVNRRVRAYFAPVNRTTGTPALFDAAQNGAFALNAPPAPWIDLGWCGKFARKSLTKVGALRTGAPAVAQTQVRTEIEATVSLEFEAWGKLQLALASGSEQMNLLAPASGATANGSGGVAAAPVPLAAGSTATSLNIGAAASQFSIGNLVAVDVDYTGQTGYVGSGASAAYVSSAATVNSDINYIRRVSLNVGRITAIANGALQLASPLLAGAPTIGMQVSKLIGFVDREGGGWFQEWSALFVMDGEQGDRVLYHYPRLQAMQGAAESSLPIVAPLEKVRLSAAFRALPIKDANDSQTVVCFRSYLPADMRAV